MKLANFTLLTACASLLSACGDSASSTADTRALNILSNGNIFYYDVIEDHVN